MGQCKCCCSCVLVTKMKEKIKGKQFLMEPIFLSFVIFIYCLCIMILTSAYFVGLINIVI